MLTAAVLVDIAASNKVMVVSTPDIMRTPEALAVFGPRAFGLDHEFTPIEQLS